MCDHLRCLPVWYEYIQSKRIFTDQVALAAFELVNPFSATKKQQITFTSEKAVGDSGMRFKLIQSDDDNAD